MICEFLMPYFMFQCFTKIFKDFGLNVLFKKSFKLQHLLLECIEPQKHNHKANENGMCTAIRGPGHNLRSIGCQDGHHFEAMVPAGLGLLQL